MVPGETARETIRLVTGSRPAEEQIPFSGVAAEVYRLLAGKLMPLVHRGSHPEAIARLQGRQPLELFPDAQAAAAATAGLWLAAGGWVEAHEIAQGLGTPEGAFWHAIVHRQEPDASNAKYWFRQAGAHPIYPELAAIAASIDEQAGKKLGFSSSWDPAFFVDLCGRSNGGDQEAYVREVQHAEWRLLLRYCARSRAH